MPRRSRHDPIEHKGSGATLDPQRSNCLDDAYFLCVARGGIATHDCPRFGRLFHSGCQDRRVADHYRGAPECVTDATNER